MQIDSVHIDVRIFAVLQEPVPQSLNMDVSFLVQLADSGWRYLAAPQRLSYVPYSADRDTSQVHLDERFLHILSD